MNTSNNMFARLAESERIMEYDYTGRPLNDDEVLVLMPYDEMDVRVNCKNKNNIVTVSKGGRSVRGVWKAVPAEWADEARTQFNSWARDQIPALVEGRCLIPQADGSTKPCPRKNDNNRCACTQCPHHGEYEREVVTPVSIDQMISDYSYDLLPSEASPEVKMLEEIDNAEGMQRANEFLHQLTDISPKHGLAAKLMAGGMRGKPFADEMGLGHDCANRVRQQIMDLAESGIDSFDQIDLSALKANRSKLDDYYRRRASELSDPFE